MRVIEACTKSGGAALSGSDARQERAGIVRRRVGAGGERGEAAEARRRAALRPGVVMVCTSAGVKSERRRRFSPAKAPAAFACPQARRAR